MKQKLARAWAATLVILKAAPTWLTMVSTVITIVAGSLGVPVVAAVGVSVSGALVVAAQIIRRVTPVLPDERGILPKAQD